MRGNVLAVALALIAAQASGNDGTSSSANVPGKDASAGRRLLQEGQEADAVVPVPAPFYEEQLGQVITLEGTLVVAITHKNDTMAFKPSVVVNGSISYPLAFTETDESEVPPATHRVGAAVSVTGMLTMQGIQVPNWDGVDVTGVAASGDLTHRLKFMKAIWFHMVGGGACGASQSEQEARDMMGQAQSLFRRCSNDEFKFNVGNSQLVGNVPIDCGSCDANFMEAQRQKALQAARSRGIDPNTYPFHFFSWPAWVSDHCFPGQAMVGCKGHDGYPCRAEVAYPWTNDVGSVVHELGHNIGLQHATATESACGQSEYPGDLWLGCGTGEYGDQTSPMGLNLAHSCFNLPQQHYLKWTQPQHQMDESNLPVGQAVTRWMSPLTSAKRAGVRIQLGGAHAVYVDWLRKAGGRRDMLEWWSGKVGLYSFEWDGRTFEPGFFSSPKSSFLGALSFQGDRQVLQGGALPSVVIKRHQIEAASDRVKVQICRFATSPSECAL